jgi:uncharacterized protein YndB with AHSA1/START domain
MIPKAPVQATRSVQITAPLGKVWSILTGVSDWERWHPYLKDARLEGPFSADTQLTDGGFIKHKLRIAKVVPGALAMLYGTMAGYKGITRWDVKQVNGARTEVSFTESAAGFMIGTLYSNRKLGEHLQNWLNALKAEAERSA